jgi:hypothetical protein
MQHGRDTIRVEMRDHQGRVTAILNEIGPETGIDYQRLAKRIFVNYQAAQEDSPHYSCHVLAGNREIGSYSRRQLFLET